MRFFISNLEKILFLIFEKMVGQKLFSKSLIQIIKSSEPIKRCFSATSASNMRFVQFQINGGPQRLGAQICTGGDIFEISAVDSSIPNSLPKFLASDSTIHERAKRYVSCFYIVDNN